MEIILGHDLLFDSMLSHMILHHVMSCPPICCIPFNSCDAYDRLLSYSKYLSLYYMPILHYIKLPDSVEEAEEERRVAVKALEKAAQGATHFHNTESFSYIFILPFNGPNLGF